MSRSRLHGLSWNVDRISKDMCPTFVHDMMSKHSVVLIQERGIFLLVISLVIKSLLLNSLIEHRLLSYIVRMLG